MDEYIRADNDFRQRREEAYRFSEMIRGFGGRVHPRHVRTIHSSSQSIAHLTVFRTAAKLLQAASSKGQRRQGLRRKIWGSAQENLLLILWWGQGPYYKTVPNHYSEAKGDSRSRSSAESAEAGLAHCFVPLSLHTRICGQSSCSFCCFD
jgi:hypothetical protein